MKFPGIPNSFQKGCLGSRATYTLRDDGKISVLNECYDKTFDGKLRSAKEQDKVKGPKFLVYFTLEKILPLIGSGETEITIT